MMTSVLNYLGKRKSQNPGLYRINFDSPFPLSRAKDKVIHWIMNRDKFFQWEVSAYAATYIEYTTTPDGFILDFLPLSLSQI